MSQFLHLSLKRDSCLIQFYSPKIYWTWTQPSTSQVSGCMVGEDTVVFLEELIVNWGKQKRKQKRLQYNVINTMLEVAQSDSEAY